MTAGDFWNNKDRAQATIDEASAVRAKVLPLEALILKTDDLEILKTLAEEETDPDGQSTAYHGGGKESIPPF